MACEYAKNMQDAAAEENPGECVYMGECIWLESPQDAVRVTVSARIEKEPSREIHGKPSKSVVCAGTDIPDGKPHISTSNLMSNPKCSVISALFLRGSLFRVPMGAEYLTIEHLEYEKPEECTEKYCLANTVPMLVEKVVHRRKLAVIEPFTVRERVNGNYIEVEVEKHEYASRTPNEQINITEHAPPPVFGRCRMQPHNGKYRIPVQAYDEATRGMKKYITVFARGIEYAVESRLKVPRGFFYKLKAKRLNDREYFIYITLRMRKYLEEYNICLDNPIQKEKYMYRLKKKPFAGSGKEASLDSDSEPQEQTAKYVQSKTHTLYVEYPDKRIKICNPENTTEVCLKTLAVKKRTHQHFHIRVNGYPISFRFRCERKQMAQ